MAADFMANLGCELGRRVILCNTDIPRKLKGIVRIDGCGLPNIRLIKM